MYDDFQNKILIIQIGLPSSLPFCHFCYRINLNVTYCDLELSKQTTQTQSNKHDNLISINQFEFNSNLC